MGASTAIIAAQATMAAASAVGQVKAGNSQQYISKAEATIDHAQNEFKLARTAATQSEEFRRNLASTVTLASARGGAGMARQFGSQAIGSFNQDIEAIKRAYLINDIQKQNKLAQAASNRSTSRLGAIAGFGTTVFGGPIKTGNSDF